MVSGVEDISEENLSPAIIIPEEWANSANNIAHDSITSMPPITLVCGPKNSGKTTLSRYFLNVLLQRYRRVAYLDTDVGQTEFTPPGLLSLTLIDNITLDLTIPCLKTPERCFFFGDVSSKRDPSAYLTCIHALYDYYRQKYCTNETVKSGNAGVPLVINTPGWVKGIGYDILVDIIKYVSPTYVVKINISAETKNLPSGTFWLDKDSCATTVIEVKSARQDSFQRSLLIRKDARLLRELRLMAYFRQCFPSNRNLTTIKELSHALACHCPYEINVSSIKIKHLHCQVPRNEIFYSLNASIVGLGVSCEGSEHLPHCVGLGIVRGVDATKGILYVITPVPHSALEKVDLLMKGFIQIPTCLLQAQGYVSPYMSRNVLTVD